ncbi:MAG: FAD-dependent oxidoreductase [Desulfamplus sp.]|nr:FAD-dependent oxidoreductase [Desulfamplus sp.]
MVKKVVIVGAVALGPKVACRLRRLDPDVEITVIDKDSLISYGGCGIPYYVGGDVAELEGLYSTIAHAKRDASFFRNIKGFNVLTRTEAIEIKRSEKKVVVRYLDEETEGESRGEKSGEETNRKGKNREGELEYDKLVIATGATPIRPPFPGSDLPKVHVVSNLHHASAIKTAISNGAVERAVVIGAGAIGIEMAEALTDLWGIETTVVEMADQVLPQALGKDMARIVEKKLQDRGVKLLLSQKVIRINGDTENGVDSVEIVGQADITDLTQKTAITDKIEKINITEKTEKTEITEITEKITLPCDMVILAAGVRPNSELAVAAGLAVGRNRGILVNRCMQTTDPDIYAGGDCAEFTNLVSGLDCVMPLGSLANRQGRIIATNINGGNDQFPGSVGTFCIKIFDMGVAKAGLTFAQAKAAGFDPVQAVVAQSDRAHFFPDAEFMFMKLIADRKTRTVLGVEAAGPQGDAVKARVDAVAPLLKFGVDVSEICNLEVSYSPPYASAMDVVNNAGNALDNTLNGNLKSVDTFEFIELLKKGGITVLDVRSSVQAAPFIGKYPEQWINIPQDELRRRWEEILEHVPVKMAADLSSDSSSESESGSNLNLRSNSDLSLDLSTNSNLPSNKPLYIICGTGPRSYETQVFLNSKGITNTRNVQGGYAMVLAIHSSLV